MKSRPMTRTNLDKAISHLAGGDPALAVAKRMSMASAIVGQFLGDAVVKGGSALRLRYGAAMTRNTMDLDTARRGGLDDFLKALRQNLSAGWEGFTGEVEVLRQSAPRGVPWEYVMQPCDVKLRYMGRSWCTVRLEVGHNEVGDADESETLPMPGDVAADFESLLFPVPAPAPLMPLAFQIAQKLHGLTAAGSLRVRDLVDLQIILSRGEPDWARLRDVCLRLFAYRKCQPWPPHVVEGEEWGVVYSRLAGNLPVLPSCAEAVAWANELVARIDNA